MNESKLLRDQPMSVSVTVGRTINLGNYESARVDIALAASCYPSDEGSAYAELSETANAMLRAEMSVVAASVGKGGRR